MEKPEANNYAEKIAALERRRYRAECRVRCLEANLDRIDPQEFDVLMDSIEAAQAEMRDAYFALLSLQIQKTGGDG